MSNLVTYKIHSVVADETESFIKRMILFLKVPEGESFEEIAVKVENILLEDKKKKGVDVSYAMTVISPNYKKFLVNDNYDSPIYNKKLIDIVDSILNDILKQ